MLQFAAYFVVLFVTVCMYTEACTYHWFTVHLCLNLNASQSPACVTITRTLIMC